MPDFAAYDAALGNRVDHGTAGCLGVLCGGGWIRAVRLHQVWPDLGRLDAVAEILQIGSLLAERPAAAGESAGIGSSSDDQGVT
jgi:hypothetical protein